MEGESDTLLQVNVEFLAFWPFFIDKTKVPKRLNNILCFNFSRPSQIWILEFSPTIFIKTRLPKILKIFKVYFIDMKKSSLYGWKKDLQWNLCNPTPEFSDILWHSTKIYGPKVFLLIKIKPEYYDILYNLTHFPCPLVCQIRQVLTSCTTRHISLVPWCVRVDRFLHPVQYDTFPLSFGVSD